MKSRARANGGHKYWRSLVVIVAVVVAGGAAAGMCSVRAALKRQLYLQLDELDEEI